ncbi:DUF4962 domain-containing protein [Dysgonomonas sp. 511]|uniref:DUF4962 domain-containing protein n=1 Tax=Dysgonomonas sp. 511 TaxID=2302930 RepID=UPI0013D5ACB5|nr:DUF4962 domain-containing protein [Dysgonomonas sp. 511]NDV79501.1 DUF4962 domain-containing protein [Dysgonomonas sp. 511]
MKNRICIILLLSLIVHNVLAQSTIKLTDATLMHEMRETSSPLNNAVISDRNVSFMWPLKDNTGARGSALDGVESKTRHKKPDANKVNYKLRFSQDPALEKDVVNAETSWPFYNPEQVLSPGIWYWQYAYVDGDKTEWSEKLQFTVKDNPAKFCPPPYSTVIKKLPTNHPRILVFESEWDSFISQNKQAQEREWYLGRADKVLKTKLANLANDIDTSKVAGLDNAVKRNALLTRESRRIIDREESNIEVLVRAYVLTKDKVYYDAAMKRIEEMVSWKNSPYLVGDFNQATLLSLSSMAYDSFYSLLSDSQKQMLLKEIKENGSKIFNHFVNHLENHIADNHNWQMNLRIFTMAAFAVYGELPEAAKWTEYSYNIWLARFPGLNADGGWHNGDSYFHVNIRTLVEVPYFYSRLSGYDFFSDPWYKGSAMYVIYQQPPFSKSGGNGSSHQNVKKPNGPRLAYADALAKLTNNTYLADYVRTISGNEPELMKKGFMGKAGDLSWFRMQCQKQLPRGKGLESLPLSYVFPQTGLASFMSDWHNLSKNAMLSFRSSPYGSTSHALANQNAFNTFYGGKSLFYSSGHHISFTDQHSIYSHRSTRAHNTILVNGMGQKIGTEGYGWIPRYYSGSKIGYVVGDASNAYGEVTSSLWLERGRLSELEYIPENGWDKNHLKTFRRHIVQLGSADLIFIYDELEADTDVNWNYLLHTVENPMTVEEKNYFVHIKATNADGVSDAYLFSSDKLDVEESNKFFYPAINWLRADDKGHFAPYKDHWHFTATTPKKKTCRFATVISTHHQKDNGAVPQLISNDRIQVGEWIIKLSLSSGGKTTFSVENKKENVSLVYDDTTTISEEGKTTVLKDMVPELEI